MSMTFARLELTDGSTSIDLLRGGVYAKDYRPGIPQLKDGGIWQDNALATGRRLVDRRFGNVIDTLDMAISGPNQDDTIARCGDLLRLLEKARDFSASSWQSDPVWLKRQAGCETNPTYALVFDYSLPELSNPFAAPFAAATELATLDGFDLGIEHSIWLSEPPGTGACVQVSTNETVGLDAAWKASSATPTNHVHSLLQTVTGRILAGSTGKIDQSDDDGDTWALCTAAPVDDVNCMIQTTAGRIIAGETGGVWHSHDDGATWVFSVEAFTVVYSLLELTSGRILAGDRAQIWASDDGGDTWATVTTTQTLNVLCMIQTTSGRVLACDRGHVWASDDNGATWYIIGYSTRAAQDMNSMLQTASGLILRDDYGQLARSADDGSTWAVAAIIAGTTQLFSQLQLANGRILVGEDDGIFESTDGGYTFALIASNPIDEIRCLLQTTTGRILAGAMSYVFMSGPIVDATMGAAASCADEQFIANKRNSASLTHIFICDGGVWTGNLLPMLGFPRALLPPAPQAFDANSDAIYFGVESPETAGDPFESLVFDIDDPVTYTSSYTITWEYWDGAAWQTLTVQDGTNPGAGAFLNRGVVSVHWEPPEDWDELDLSDAPLLGPAVAGVWVRARVSALVGSMTPPTQQHRSIYTITWPDVNVASAQVAGDIPALARAKLRNRSDQYLQAVGTNPVLYDNRIVLGLRSYDRGPNFTAYLNASNEQNPAGIVVTAGANTTIAADLDAITGKLTTWAAALADTTFTTRVTWTLQTTVARDFYGTFHTYVRAGVSAGSSSDIHARLQVTTGTGGVTMNSADDYLKGTTNFEVLDLGRISIPASGLLSFNDLGDQTTLALQFRNDSGAARTVKIHDLILIPVDEWATDAADYANTADSMVGSQDSLMRLLDLDSVTYNKVDVRALVRTADANQHVTGVYVPSGGPAILQANARQRLWGLCMKTSTTGTSYRWIAPPWIAHSVQVWANSRWLAMRGDR